jgi:hypothetical protein
MVSGKKENPDSSQLARKLMVRRRLKRCAQGARDAGGLGADITVRSFRGFTNGRESKSSISAA